jgi:serpin B
MTSMFSLKKPLSALGMPLAFDLQRADFSGIASGESLAISAVLHKAFVDVNEAGTEAAAASAVVISRTSALPENPPVFRADHPFLFLIRDRRTGTILFLGRVQNPNG